MPTPEPEPEPEPEPDSESDRDTDADSDRDAEPEPEPDRPPAALTTTGALRCYLDQLPPDRCVLCSVTAELDTHARVPLCRHHRQKPLVPTAIGAVLVASTTGYIVLHGTENLVQTLCGYLLAAMCFGIALQRRRLRAALPATVNASGMIELADVAPGVSRAVLALGARPFRTALPKARIADPRDDDSI